MGKVLFVATVVKTHIMEFHVPYLKMFKGMGWETAVAARNDYDIPADCRIPYCDAYYDVPFARNPLKSENLAAYTELKRIIDKEHFDIVHCHTPVGAMVARLAARDAAKKGTRVVYTAHGFHFYQGAPLLNWMIYYPAEKYFSKYTDVLITINKEDYQRAQSFRAKRVCYVPGVGINLGKFDIASALHKASRTRIRTEFGIPETATVLLSVGEVNKNKNHRVVIEAIGQLAETDVYYVICGRGPLVKEYEKLAEKIGVSNRVILTGYRDDVADFYQAADIFVFPSLREGLPVAVMEAMASGLPIVCGKIRGCSDLVENGSGGIFVDCKDSFSIAKAIEKLINCDRAKIAQINRIAAQKYGLQIVSNAYKEIYNKCLTGGH